MMSIFEKPAKLRAFNLFERLVAGYDPLYQELLENLLIKWSLIKINHGLRGVDNSRKNLLLPSQIA